MLWASLPTTCCGALIWLVAAIWIYTWLSENLQAFDATVKLASRAGSNTASLALELGKVSLARVADANVTQISSKADQLMCENLSFHNCTTQN